jgi:hypothetical protein
MGGLFQVDNPAQLGHHENLRLVDYDWTKRTTPVGPPIDPKTGIVVKPDVPQTRWYTSPEVGAIAEGAGHALTIIAVAQSLENTRRAVQSDIQQGTGGAQTAGTVAHEAAGWAGALYYGEIGGALGSFAGPLGTLVGGLAFGGFGYFAGASAIDILTGK